ncbi:MAG: transcription elongation factor GreB [Gammaproteobacteria bacterium]|nr:transcription elongation factor GreB [Gammaproteobacteria bacterium]
MGRYRPPTKPSAPFITAGGFKALSDEYAYLWQKKRPEVVKALSAAAAEGDRSENAEYQYRRKQLAEIDRRIRYLKKRLPSLKVVSETPDDTDRIFFGAFVTLMNEEGLEFNHRIVGADEIDTQRSHITLDSPMAKSLLGKRVDDIVMVAAPSGTTEYEIIEIRYDQ